MIRFESQCVDCGLGGCAVCPLSEEVEVHYCDKCGTEIDNESYYNEYDDEYCEECYEELFGCNINGEIKCSCCGEYYDSEEMIAYEDEMLCEKCYNEEINE